MNEHNLGNVVALKVFRSASKDPNGYVVGGDYMVHMVIDGVSGRDMSENYSAPKQQEVVLMPGIKLAITRISTANGGNVLIHVKEETENGVVVFGYPGEQDGIQNSPGNGKGIKGNGERNRYDFDGMGLHNGRGQGTPAESERVPIYQPGSVYAGEERVSEDNGLGTKKFWLQFWLKFFAKLSFEVVFFGRMDDAVIP